MKRLIDFCLLLLMVFWGSNAWADKTMTFGAASPTNDCNLTKLNVDKGKSQSIENGGITLTITAASDDNASWNPAAAGSNHGQTIALKASANITISSSSAETKITKIVFNFETNNKGYFAESSTTGGTLAPTEATSYVTTQTWSSDQGASSVSLTSNNTKNKAYITSIDITYKTGGLDNHTVQAYPYTWNFREESLWETQKANSYLKFGQIPLTLNAMNGETLVTNLLLPQVMMWTYFVVFASQVTYAQIKKETAFPFQEMPPSPFLLFMKDRR